MPLIDNHYLKTQILVAGGGMAGVCCAIAAARCGTPVILCQDRSVLGGNASSEVRMHIVGANGTGKTERGEELQTEAREGGIIEEIRLENSVRNPQRSASLFDLILYEKCRAESNLTLMLNTSLVAVEMQGDCIKRITAHRQSTEDIFQIEALIFVDCTGDGRLAAEAGAEFMEGRESQTEFGELLAPQTADNKRLGSTILMQARKHEKSMPFVPPDWARKFSEDDLKLRLYATPGDEKPTHEYGYWWAEWGGELDTIKQNETIRDELLAIVFGIWDHVKNGPHQTDFGAENWALDWFGFLPGKRESRRFVGQTILTQQDLLTSREFPDAIAFGGWSLDLHPPGGVDAPGLQPCEQHPVPHLYDIPFSACIAKKVQNLMFAGRNISATHVAFSSTRVMATCAAIGQGVGTAAAIAVQNQIEVQSLSKNPVAIKAIQQQLLRDDVYLIGLQNEDENDLARNAKISSTSEQPGFEASNIISGQTRCANGKHGVAKSKHDFNSHRWMSHQEHQLPVCVLLEWESAIRPVEIQLVFDTGLHRHLTLSHHDGYTATMQWGTPQPETVRDYFIEGFDGNKWHRLLNVTDNYQRLRTHPIKCEVQIHRLRITITVTNGINQARICEIRVYQ